MDEDVGMGVSGSDDQRVVQGVTQMLKTLWVTLWIALALLNLCFFAFGSGFLWNLVACFGSLGMVAVNLRGNSK